MSQIDEGLTHEEIAQLNERKAELKAQHMAYVEDHPEIKTLLNDFVCACLLEKPDNILNFAREHFANMKPKMEGLQPLVVAGPSGVGKGTIIKIIQDKYSGKFGFSVSHTTRGPREGEENGVHYHFTDQAAMRAEIEDGKFIEHAEVHGNLYGTSVAAVQSVSEEGKICILDIDVQGVQKVKASALEPKYIFISPPSMEVLEERLRGRKTETEEAITKRLAGAQAEMDYSAGDGNFDRVFINDNLDTCVADIESQLLEWYPSLIANNNGEDN
uniref:guanylate kinase n=1 Tax=Heterosigma akashiwo TaxID=2829 RepID=A0A7S3UUW8_HETAK